MKINPLDADLLFCAPAILLDGKPNRDSIGGEIEYPSPLAIFQDSGLEHCSKYSTGDLMDATERFQAISGVQAWVTSSEKEHARAHRVE